jgi:hypothetical protein
MPKSESQRMDALEALLAERRKHEGYLEKLEERRAKHARARVRPPARRVPDQAHRPAGARRGGGGSARHRHRGGAGGSRGDRPATWRPCRRNASKGELRAEVGEYDAKDWSKKLTVLNATIAQLEKEREAKAGAYERTLRLLNDARP